MFDDYDKIFWQARLGVLPRDYVEWGLMDVTGVTVAHTVVGHGHQLPADFDQWGMLDEHGRTVAHVAVTTKAFPPGYAGWEEQGVWRLRNLAGWTVAHFAAHHGTLPADFDQWTLENRGVTVAHAAAEAGTLPPGFADWGIKDAEGRTVADVHREASAARITEKRSAAYGVTAILAFALIPFLFF
jgi:hypothetical protein